MTFDTKEEVVSKVDFLLLTNQLDVLNAVIASYREKEDLTSVQALEGISEFLSNLLEAYELEEYLGDLRL